MGSVFKKSVTKPLPDGAEIITRKGEKLARWKDAKGKTRTAPLTDAGNRIRVESGTWYAKLRDGSGIIVEVPTGCRQGDRRARQAPRNLERQAEYVRSGLLTADEAPDRGTPGATPISQHFDAYLDSLEAWPAPVPLHRLKTSEPT